MKTVNFELKEIKVSIEEMRNFRRYYKNKDFGITRKLNNGEIKRLIKLGINKDIYLHLIEPIEKRHIIVSCEKMKMKVKKWKESKMSYVFFETGRIMMQFSKEDDYEEFKNKVIIKSHLEAIKIIDKYYLVEMIEQEEKEKIYDRFSKVALVENGLRLKEFKQLLLNFQEIANNTNKCEGLKKIYRKN